MANEEKDKLHLYLKIRSHNSISKQYIMIIIIIL